MRTSHHAYARLFAVAHAGLVTNLLLTLTCLPVLVVVLSGGRDRNWPALAVLAPLAAPALTAAFAVFATITDTDDGAPPLRTFVGTWRRSLRTALTVGAAGTAALVILGVDIAAVWRHRIGALAIPAFAMLAVLVVASAVTALALLAERPDLRARDLLRAGLWLSVRRWYLTGMSLGVLALLVTFVTAQPALALGVATAPLLYVVWANSRYALQPVLG